MAGLLGKLITTPAAAQVVDEPLARGHLDRLIQAFARQGLTVVRHPRPGGAIVPGLVEPLTAPRAGGTAAARCRPAQPGHRQRAGGHPGYGQAPREPPILQARGRQPHGSRRSGPGAGTAALAPMETTLLGGTGKAGRRPAPCADRAGRSPPYAAPRRSPAQVTAVRWKIRSAAPAASTAQMARTNRLNVASSVVLAKPHTSCRPAPLRSRTP